MTPDLIKALVEAGQLLLSVVIASGSAVWVFLQWLDQKRAEAAREQERRAEAARQDALRLAQEREAAAQRRTQNAAELVRAFGEAKDTEARMWAAMALSLYPDHTLPLLAIALGEIDAAGASGVETALTSLGTQSLPALARMNRLAASQGEAVTDEPDGGEPSATILLDTGAAGVSATQRLQRVKRVMNQIIVNAEAGSLAEIDLADVDLSAAWFRAARLERANFRKCRLEQADFTRADLREASFRGALLQRARFTRARLEQADFTGAAGPAGFVAVRARNATFKDGRLAGSAFDGSHLEDADLEAADLSNASVPGVQLHGARLRKTRLDHARGRALKVYGSTLSHASLRGARFPESGWSRTAIDNTAMTAIDLAGARLASGRIVNCNLGGAKLVGARLTGMTLDRCQLGGVTFAGAVLEDCTFRDCAFSATSFDGATLTRVAFAGANTLAGRPVTYVQATLVDVTFADGSAAVRPEAAPVPDS